MLGIVLLYLTYRWVKSSVDQWVKDYTGTQPAKIEQVTLPPDQFQGLTNRLYSFSQAVKQNQAGMELTLSAEEINGLIAQDPHWKQLRDHVFVRIEGDQISGDVSVPLSDIGPVKLAGRYLNGVAAFKVGLTNQILTLQVQELKVNNKAVPELILSEIKKINLAEEMESNPEAKELLGKIDAVGIQDGKLVVRTKPANP